MQEYLAFIDEIGRTIDGNYLYRFDFTKEPDTVWGEYFNVTPSIIIPNLQPDNATLSKTGRVELPIHILLAKKSGCFSMQDCFDNIIPLGFTAIDDENDLIFRFGDTYESVIEKLHEYNTDLVDIEEIETDGDEIIDNLIENIAPERKEIITFDVGKVYRPYDIPKLLFDNGYERTDYVHKKKQYSLRGYILDIFTPDDTLPYRITFFGDVVEEIYNFDINEQTPIDNFTTLTIYGDE